MKFALVIPDGAADEPVPELNGKTALEAANLPHLDRLAGGGKLGLVKTLPPELPPLGELALQAILGYDVRQTRVARGPLEARARGVRLGRDDLALRCNLVTVVDDTLLDFAAGYISTPEAARLINALQPLLLEAGLELIAGESFRHTLVWRDAAANTRISSTHPQELVGQSPRKGMPRGRGAEPLKQFIARAAELLAEHDVNAVREELGENRANGVWLWGEGSISALPRFSSRFGVRGAVVTGMDAMRGLADLIGWQVLDAPGVNGLLSNDYAAQGWAAVEALQRFDLVCVHIEAPDEAAHMGRADEKVRALEAIDTHIVGPLLARLADEREWRILVIVDHATSLASRRHTHAAAPFLIAGSDVVSHRGDAFDEAAAAQGELHVDRASDLMEYFLRR